MKNKGYIWPAQYCQNPNPNKTLSEIWDDIDGYTYEAQFEQEDKKGAIDFVIPLPPLDDGKIKTKGIFYSQAVDAIVEACPKIKEIFIPVGNSMFTSYPQSEYADAIFVCYNNKQREKYWRKKHPEKKDVVLLPLQDADFTNEYIMAPSFFPRKDTDVFCVASAFPFKNMPMVAAAVKYYELKYGYRLKVKCAIGLPEAIKKEDGSMDYSQIRGDAVEQMQRVDQILGDTKSYIDFYPYIGHGELPKYYSSAKCVILASLIEGKNRALQEAMSCNTPIVVFKDHNKFTRGDYKIIPDNCGEYAKEYSSEALADAIHKVLMNQEKYQPRRMYLKNNGRLNFINKMVDMLPYFKNNLPEYKKGRLQENLWVDLAMQRDYQLSFHDFLYGKNPAIQQRRGIDDIKDLMKFFYSRFGIQDGFKE